MAAHSDDQNNYVISVFMQRIYGSWAGRLAAGLIMWTAFASVFSLLLGYSRVPYAAALDGNYFRAFARVHPEHRFPTVSLLALGGVAMLFCFLRLADVIAALVVIRILLQFIVQAVGVMVLRKRRPDLPRPFRMWLYPVPALVAIAGFTFILVARQNFLREIRYAVVILIAGLIIYFVRSWRRHEWPFRVESSSLEASRMTPLVTDCQPLATSRCRAVQNRRLTFAALHSLILDGHQRSMAGRTYASSSTPATAEGTEPVSELGSLPELPIAPPRRRSVIGPLHEPLFRTLWIAAVVSYTGTWMQNVGAGWLMTSLTMSPLMVGLVQAAGSIAVFLVVLPAGAIADVVDRRKLLLFTQTWMVLAAVGLGVLTLAGRITPDASAVVYLADGLRRGAERSRVAGHHAGDCFAPELCRRHRAELRRIQRGPRHRSGAWRTGHRRHRFGDCVSAERGFVLRRHLLPVSVEAQAGPQFAAARPHDERHVRRAFATCGTRRR